MMRLGPPPPQPFSAGGRERAGGAAAREATEVAPYDADAASRARSRHNIARRCSLGHWIVLQQTTTTIIAGSPPPSLVGCRFSAPPRRCGVCTRRHDELRCVGKPWKQLRCPPGSARCREMRVMEDTCPSHTPKPEAVRRNREGGKTEVQLRVQTASMKRTPKRRLGSSARSPSPDAAPFATNEPVERGRQLVESRTDNRKAVRTWTMEKDEAGLTR